MSETVIKVENISKQYRLGSVGTGSLAHDINRSWHKLRGKDDPYLKIGESNDRSVKGNSEYVWALREINFEVKQGEILGIIGRNGAGKSTLLKILSRTTTPTTGQIKIKGRVASLLEVGTGFHPELSGRENIFLNGAILGMTRQEIKKKFDEIVDFAGVERYIDTPVKRYSSGMYVRLAFGVAAHLEPEILIVDEVLAVGDAEFQKKALGKMKDVSGKDGRTVLFVSHNMQAMKTLCSNGILLQNGTISERGTINNAIEAYLNNKIGNHVSKQFLGGVYIKKAQIRGERGVINYGDKVIIEMAFECTDGISNIVIGYVIKDIYDIPITGFNNRHYLNDKLNDETVYSGSVETEISDFKLIPGDYSIDLHLGDSTHNIEKVEYAIAFTVEESRVNSTATKIDYSINKLFLPNISWKIYK